ncbi:Putative poly(R)-hydroxyalkanoic acid synthase (Pha) [gamma proteobacterium HdN1]|nr:Putative poly(R)-hydroxyalkanoic acid synthase (Pha) [gamma proteobacterium HdN1]
MGIQTARRQARQIARNARDRIFNPESLVRTGNTPFEVLHDNGLVKLRYYSPVQTSPAQANAPTQTSNRALDASSAAPALEPAQPATPIPLVIVPPLAINMLVYDLFPERSFVQYFTQLGFPVYLIDWGTPGLRQAHYTLSRYVKKLMPEFIGKVREHSGSDELSLQGWSMGGGIALAYTAYHHDHNIRNLLIMGTAIDGHANGPLGRNYQKLANWLEKRNLNARKLPASMAYSPAWMNIVGFKLSDPVGSLRGYRDLLKNLHDRDYVAQHATQAAFIDNLVAYPGGVIRDWMASVWLENETARGQITLGREVTHLRTIKSNVLGIAGSTDTLANVNCCKALMNVVGSQDKQFHVAPGGHTGIMAGSRAREAVWEKASEWLLARSG